MQGLNCTRKQVEISEILHKNNIDLLAVQESWEVTGMSKFLVPGYTWFGKPRSKESCKNLKRGDGGVGFLVREGLEEMIRIINDVEYDESIWLKLSRGGRNECCIYLPIQGTHVDRVQECYEKLSLDISRFRNKGRIILLGDFNARVGKGLDSDDIVGLYG